MDTTATNSSRLPHRARRTAAAVAALAVVAAAILVLPVLHHGRETAAVPEANAPQAPPHSRIDEQGRPPHASGPVRERISGKAHTKTERRASASARKEPRRPTRNDRFFAARSLIVLPPEEVVDRLDLPPDVRAALDTPNGRRLVAEELQLAGRRFGTYMRLHGERSILIARNLLAKGLSGSPKPPADHEDDYVKVSGPSGPMYLSYRDYPELDEIFESMVSTPSALRERIVRRVREAARGRAR